MSVLGTDLGAALPELQAESEGLMVTPVTLERKAGSTINPDNGQRVDEWAEVWSGLCRVTSRAESVERVIGGQRVTFKPHIVAVPLAAQVDGRQGDRFVTDLGTFWVVDIPRKSLTHSQKYTCSENQEVLAP